MITTNVDQVIVHAELTPELAMELIRNISYTGSEAASIRIEMRRYCNDDANLYISIDNGFAISLDVQTVSVVACEAEVAGK